MQLISKVKESFSSFENTIKTLILCCVPILVFCLVFSDRNPFNYIAFAAYGITTILILFYLIAFRKIVFDFYSIILFTFLFLILITQLLNNRIFEFPRTILLLIVFSFFFYEFAISLEKKEKDSLYKLILLGGIFVGVFLSIYYFNDIINMNFDKRIGRDFSDQNDLAKNLAIFAIISELLLFKSKKVSMIVFNLILTLFFLYLILMTGSISNLLTFILISFVIFITLFSGKKRIISVAVSLCLIAAFIGLLQLPAMSYFRNRLINMINSIFSGSGNVDYSFLERFKLALYGLQLFISKPLFGYGYDQVKYYTIGKNTFSHNNFVELLGSFGFFGFVVFELLLLLPIIVLWKKRKTESFSLYLILYIFIFQIFLIVYRKKIEYILIPIAFSNIHFFRKFNLSFYHSNHKFELRKGFSNVTESANIKEEQIKI